MRFISGAGKQMTNDWLRLCKIAPHRSPCFSSNGLRSVGSLRSILLCLAESFVATCLPAPLMLCALLCAEESTYFIAIKKNEGDIIPALETFIPFLPPQGRFYADPFLFKYEGINYLFFEDYDYQKGVISYVPLGPEGPLAEPQLALELPIHLSFPYVFQDEGQIYMLPETYRYRSVSLYRCTAFPNQWEHQRVLVRGELFSDPILFKYNGYYWLFASIHRDRLVIYYAKDLDSRFRPHPINRRQIRGRNAGPVFYRGERAIRPVMDCSQRYGRSMILKEIVLLTPLNFVEKAIGYIEPNWAPHLVGTHTYSLNEDYLVYDGERLGRDP